MRWRSALSFVGRTFITTGLLILLFVAYQLWGTGLYEQRQQRSLKSQFQQAAAKAHPGTSTTTGPGPSSTTTTTVPDIAPPPPSGEAVAIIRIPKIGLDRAVVQGVSLADLRKGPGHYPRTVMPGELGNAAIAGHRTTYGAPFNRIDELAPGDDILVTTLKGTYRYVMHEQKVVNPTDVDVLQPTPDARLTLTSCHPKYSAAHRIVVIATLDANTSPAPAAPAALPAAPAGSEKDKRDPAGLSGVRSSRRQTIVWGIGAALVGMLWWFAFHRRRSVLVWFAGAAPFLVVLFFFYANLERVLPGNF